MVLNGPGAAGTAIIKMLLAIGVKNIIACDEHGILYKERMPELDSSMKELAEVTNKENIQGTLVEAVKGAEVFVGVSVGGVLTPEMVRTMNQDAIVFAMADPIPEIAYETAIKAGVKGMGTGRAD